jgi:hypothetical protein
MVVPYDHLRAEREQSGKDEATIEANYNALLDLDSYRAIVDALAGWKEQAMAIDDNPSELFKYPDSVDSAFNAMCRNALEVINGRECED